MSYISSLVLFIAYIYTILKYPYIKSSKIFICFFSFFTLRIILSLNHEVSFKPIFAGQSLNSIFSILTISILFLLIKKVYFKFTFMLPFYLIVSSAAISSLYSGEVMGGVIVIMKWLLLMVAVISLLQLFKAYGLINTLMPFYNIFIEILLSQFLSVIFRQGKDTESLISVSNSISYIAGYAHESAFSVLLFMGFFVSALLMQLKRVHPIVPMLFFIGLVLANYRTTLISAVIPLIGIYVAYFYIGAKKDFKVFSLGFGLLSITLISLVLGSSILERFSELGSAFASLNELISIDYSLFTIEERRLLSSRLYLWNMYLTEFSYFSLTQVIFGAGPEAWLKYFDVYSHNTYIGVLFDLGITGLCALLILFYKTFAYILRITELKFRIIMSSYFIGFFIMSNSTLPLWAIEGVYLYSYIFAIAFYASNNTFHNTSK